MFRFALSLCVIVTLISSSCGDASTDVLPPTRSADTPLAEPAVRGVTVQGTVLSPTISPKKDRLDLNVTAVASTPMPVALATPIQPQPHRYIGKSTRLTIAVESVAEPNGVPQFCTAGCSETIYMSGLTDTLFNSRANPDGTVTPEPMLALDFTLDPSLESGAFRLRRGVQFHHGWGEMTATDVVYSFNNANAATNPESIHGQAHDFAAHIASMELVDDYTVRLNYSSYDSRGVLHRFSMFWQTAGIMSKRVFDAHGFEDSQDVYVGVGAFMVEDENYSDAWDPDWQIRLVANPDYYGTRDGLGPFLEQVRWIEARESRTREAMLQSGEAAIAEVDIRDIPGLESMGYRVQKNGLSSRTYAYPGLAITGSHTAAMVEGSDAGATSRYHGSAIHSSTVSPMTSRQRRC